jgi:hypothetical protein
MLWAKGSAVRVMRVPELSCPFIGATGSWIDKVNDENLAWLHGTGLATDRALAIVEQADPAYLTAVTAPRATLQGACVDAAWQTWLFLFDDQLCDDPGNPVDSTAMARVTSRFLLIVENEGRPAATPKERGLADICRRIRAWPRLSSTRGSGMRSPHICWPSAGKSSSANTESPHPWPTTFRCGAITVRSRHVLPSQM